MKEYGQHGGVTYSLWAGHWMTPTGTEVQETLIQTALVDSGLIASPGWHVRTQGG